MSDHPYRQALAGLCAEQPRAEAQSQAPRDAQKVSSVRERHDAPTDRRGCADLWKQ